MYAYVYVHVCIRVRTYIRVPMYKTLLFEVHVHCTIVPVYPSKDFNMNVMFWEYFKGQQGIIIWQDHQHLLRLPAIAELL